MRSRFRPASVSLSVGLKTRSRQDNAGAIYIIYSRGRTVQQVYRRRRWFLSPVDSRTVCVREPRERATVLYNILLCHVFTIRVYRRRGTRSPQNVDKGHFSWPSLARAVIWVIFFFANDEHYNMICGIKLKLKIYR